MKTSPRFHSIVLSLGLIFSGCASGGGTGSVSIEQRAAMIRALTSAPAGIQLHDHPEDIPAAKALSAEITRGLAGYVVLTPELIQAVVMKVLEKNGLNSFRSAVYLNLGLNLYRIYSADFSGVAIKLSDPRAQKYVGAFRDGLNDAIALAEMK